MSRTTTTNTSRISKAHLAAYHYDEEVDAMANQHRMRYHMARAALRSGAMIQMA